jgi:glycosyltransferase involved in cell wall biosynthesis
MDSKRPFDVLTIVVSTLNRERFLRRCLEGLLLQTVGPGEVRIIVVDNGSTDGTKGCAEGLAGSFGELCVVSESRVGLSHARNRGLSECKTPWLINLDDDGIPDSNFVEEAFSTIMSGRFDCFGGVYLPYYEVKKPYWLLAGFGSNNEGEMDIVELKEGSISGGIAAYEMKHLRGIGGFPVFLGMAGNRIGYGEEDFVVQRLRANGCKIGWNPRFRMRHMVSSAKTRVLWHVKAHYAHGRARFHLKKYSTRSFWSVLNECLLGAIAEVFCVCRRRLTRKRYYIWQAVIDLAGQWAMALGIMREYQKNMFRREVTVKRPTA